ncbi:hypothetical protein GWI33_010589 [Rhynchophorus ferrugineus]|uniref:Uncharacterized protein n=1 Tax=Rhynchophorus ferrugineus TaxID=354439 RepID=A0A834MJL2_RHYFE|nr:hypothetical protein GWI33_010589 [Rhynchophorus ferrugineus]
MIQMFNTPRWSYRWGLRTAITILLLACYDDGGIAVESSLLYRIKVGNQRKRNTTMGGSDSESEKATNLGWRDRINLPWVDRTHSLYGVREAYAKRRPSTERYGQKHTKDVQGLFSGSPRSIKENIVVVEVTTTKNGKNGGTENAPKETWQSLSSQ